MGRQTREVDVAVIGAGQAGLSSAYFLRRFGFAPSTGLVVLDADAQPGGAWQHRPGSLTLSKVHGIFDLPGSHFRPGEADQARTAAAVVSDYYGAYERRYDLRVRRPVQVRSVRRAGARLLVSAAGPDGTPGQEWAARAVVNATGTWRRPYWPYYPGGGDFAGRQLHYADYHGPAEFAGQRVVVVGGGLSAMQVLSEIADVAASTTWVTRRPPEFRDAGINPDVGREVVAKVEERVRAGLPPASVVSVTGLVYTPVVLEALRKGALDRLPMFDQIVGDGVVWNDGRRAGADVIIWATGFRAVIGHLAPLRLREPGGGIRLDGTRAVAEPRLHLVGYGPSASTVGANRAGRAAAREIRDLLAAEDESRQSERGARVGWSESAGRADSGVECVCGDVRRESFDRSLAKENFRKTSLGTMTDRPGGDSSDESHEPHEPGELPHRELRDAQTLRALAHPVRLRILEELAQRGPATATELADRLGKSAANCSWHLRQLARFGFLEEAPGGTRRERFWRIVPQSQSFGHSDVNEEPELALAEDAAAEVMLAREVEALNAWRSARRSDAAEWRAGSTEFQNWTWFTAEELAAFTKDLHAVLERHQSRALARIDPARRPPGCRPVRLVGWAIPAGPETEAARDRESTEPTDPGPHD